MRNRIAIILLCFLLFASCRTEKNPTATVMELDPVFKDDSFHLALYATPQNNCIACLNRGIRYLTETAKEKEVVYIIIEPPVTTEANSFKTYIADEFPGPSYYFCEVDLKLPTPSIVLFKNRMVYMYVYIPADIYELNDVITKCRALFDPMKI